MSESHQKMNVFQLTVITLVNIVGTSSYSPARIFVATRARIKLANGGPWN